MIGLVYDNDGWVLQRVGDALCKYEGFSWGDVGDTVAYLPYYLLAGDPALPRGSRLAALFTHRETHPQAERKRQLFDEAAAKADVCWAMCEKTAEHLPSSKTFVLEIPADEQFQKSPVNIGVVGHEQPFGRKGTDILPHLANIPGIRVCYTAGRLPWEQLPDFYSKMDYILVTGTNEGGPMAVPEAVAMGKPVIAPDTGIAWNYPVIRYSTPQELVRIVGKLAPTPNRWPDFAAKLRAKLA